MTPISMPRLQKARYGEWILAERLLQKASLATGEFRFLWRLSVLDPAAYDKLQQRVRPLNRP